MGRVTTFCQISGCSPDLQERLDVDYLSEYLSDDERNSLDKVKEATRLLLTEDEEEGIKALSIIGPLDPQSKPLWQWGPDKDLTRLDEILVLAEGKVQELSGCGMGNPNIFDMGFCEGPSGEADGAQVSFGAYFFVHTMMLGILEGATQGRVSVQRLWRLAMMKGYYDAHNYYVLPGVDYGPIEHYLEQYPWVLGEVDWEEFPKIASIGTAEDIAEVLRKRGFWMWMRPDRFPIDAITVPQALTDIKTEHLATSDLYGEISKLPSEIIHSIALELYLPDIILLASLNKALYYQLLGNQEARDTLARAYIHKRARWCLPSGESELKWWSERRGDDALGWEYLRRCWSESHSMRNRRRIWRAAESIEEECERMEKEYGTK